MLLEVTRPVRGGPTGATASTKLQRPLEMAEFDTESRERCERVDDESAPVAGVMVALVGIRPLLNDAVDADQVSDDLVLPPGAGFANFRTRPRIAERTAGERLLHDYLGSSSRLSAAASYPAFQPL